METLTQPAKTHTFKVFDLPISMVTVYVDRAEVKRLVRVGLESGVNEVIVEAVSDSILSDSIRVDGRGEAVIHEVQFTCKAALPSELASPKIKKIEDERKALVEKKAVAEDRKKVVEKQMEALDELIAQVTGGVVNPQKKDKFFSLDESTFQNITKLLDFHEKNAMKVRGQGREIAKEIDELNDQIGKLDGELSRMRNDVSNSRNVNILLETQKAVSAELIVSYQVWNAKWTPSYDIRVSTGEEGKSVMKISYYGQIQQNSGEDWNDAKLVLSTAQPALGGNVPTLGTLEARFKQVQEMERGSAALFGSNDNFEVRRLKKLSLAYMPMSPQMTADSIGAGDTVLSTVFEITRPTTIPSDTSEHRVTIAFMNLNPVLVFSTVPSKSTNAFLMASLVNESVYPFIGGVAAVYFENSFIAKTNLKSVSPGESFKCSLGVDPAIKVEYKPLHKYTEQVGIISKNPCVAHEQRIVIKNTKKEEVTITVNEPIPKSTDEKIKIRLLSPSLMAPPVVENSVKKPSPVPAVGAFLNKQNNLEWTVKLEANKEIELLVKYAMEHPSNEKVVFKEAM